MKPLTKEITKELYNIKLHGETLKELVWSFLDNNRIEHKGIKDSINETLDLLDELDLEFEERGRN